LRWYYRIEEILTLTVNNQPVKVEGRAKFLGLAFDSNLNWNEHIKYIEHKCKERLMRAVAGNSWGARKKALFTIFNTFSNGAVVYNSASESIKYRLN